MLRVGLIGVHDGGEDILLTAHDLDSGFIGIRIELLGELVAAVVVKVWKELRRKHWNNCGTVCWESCSPHRKTPMKQTNERFVHWHRKAMPPHWTA